MKMRPILVFIIAAVVLTSMGCGPAAPPEPTATPTEAVHAGKAIVQNRCIGCHDINRVTNARYDELGWQLTVDRMVMSGAQLNDEQKAIVIDYLVEEYPKE